MTTYAVWRRHNGKTLCAFLKADSVGHAYNIAITFWPGADRILVSLKGYSDES